MALSAVLLLPPSSASAETTDDGQEITDFYFAGVVTNADEPVEGVVMSIEGNGFEAETETDAEGKWRLYVPEKETYTLTVDESTLPDGVIVDATQLPEGIQPVSGTTASFELEFGLTGTKIVNFFLGAGERVTVSFLDQLLSRMVGGLNFGLLLGLASMGAALIYGTTRLSNFAHGEMVTWGAVVMLLFTTFWNLPPWLGILAAVVGGAALGWALDAGIWKPLRRRGLGVVQLMIVSIGLSLALRYGMQYMIGGSTYQLPGASPEPIKLGPISLSYIDMIAMATSIIVILGVAFFLTRTRTGKATRAISDNPQLAAASGIDVDKVIRTVWILAGTLAAISGILWAYFRPGVKWDMGMQMLLLMFCAITLGGLGSAIGALIGSIIVGLAVEVSTLFGVPTDLKYATALVALIVILLVRPQGILGRKERLG
ncbi:MULTISPECIES: branched-chain amino acid ABC transporter permease [Microbacterium]|uniref:Branched-chain amino acid ABC transporter permease n=2 Tax=Microbacterium TaxID=33882 RepID=A0ABY4J6D9_9MICO|nr:MAG: branched-chain amino acid ABC transporter permease [Actinobacteria bacterium HGW-Actinobacteria-11]QEA30549.1 branched-chain amino acid ABC transporter permease [Microbacterium sp. CBA3102]TCJ23340.1 branched-chain amino acid ABC transporter permease [Microbacterium sp. PI-1]UPL19580.1 branched-chain amino acid ABC transporter permease [Microbacterium aurugineum]